MRFAFAGEHLATAGPGIVANLLRLRAEMRFGIERAIGWRQAHAGFGNQPQSSPLAVAFDAEHLRNGTLSPLIAGIRHHAAVLVFDRAQGRYFLLNQHGDTLQ